jgi:hypothetical protein
MASTLFLVLDDTATNYTYGPQNWSVSWDPHYYGGTVIYPAFINNSRFGFFEATFEGTSRCPNIFKRHQ